MRGSTRKAFTLVELLVVIAIIAILVLLLLPYPHVFGLLALLSHVAGVLVSRWLFFAEAEHVVGLYYGMR